MWRGRRIGHLWLVLFGADFCAIVAAYWTTVLVRFHGVWGADVFTALNQWLGVRETGALDDNFHLFYLASAPRIVLLLTLTLCALYALRDLYPGRRFIRPRPVAWNIVVSSLAALAIFYTYFYLRRNIFHPRSMFATILLLNIVYAVAFRAFTGHLLDWLRRRFDFDRCRTLLIGANPEAEYIHTLVGEMHPHGLDVVRRIRGRDDEPFDAFAARVQTECRAHDIHLIVVADKTLSVSQVMRLLEIAEAVNAAVKVLSDRLDILFNMARLPVDIIHGYPLVHFNAPPPDWASHRARRALTRACGALVLLPFLPLMALIALVIKLTSPGPVLFVQERIGVNRRPFLMFKFRTMRDRADELRAQLEEFNESGPGLFKMRRDPRVTAVGRFLRYYSLDELPQFFNVVRGDMALVGPRPLPRRDFESYYEEWHYSRHSGMPGLTCLWQVSGRSEIDFHNMCILDVYYLRNRNLVLDLKILLRTAWVVLFAKGAY